MKDNSKLLYDKYFELKNRTIKLILKDDRILIGQIVGYFHGDIEDGEPYIAKWHLMGKAENQSSGVDYFDEIIDQSDIKSIFFEADNSLLCFTN